MDFMEIEKKRCTVRNFSGQQVPDELLKKILEAGRWAPTAVNAQPQRILVLNTQETLGKVREFCTFGYRKEYEELAKESADQKSGKSVYYYGAPVVLMVCWDKTACWTHPESGDSSGLVDATIVATHMMLEAASLDVGSAWISYFDKKKARNLLEIPDNWEIGSLLYLGYPSEDFKPNTNLSGKRKPLTETCFYNAPGIELPMNYAYPAGSAY